MGYAIQIRQSAANALRFAPEGMAERMREAIGDLREELIPSISISFSSMKNYYRLRVGRYAIIYSVHEKQEKVIVEDIFLINERDI